MGNEDERIETGLAQSAAKLDKAEPPSPDFQFFKDIVVEQQAALRHAQRVQFAVFAVVAAMLIAALILFMGRSLFFIVALQGLAMVIAAAALSAFFLKSRRQHAGARS
jgi:hypothetical protein